MIVKKETNKSIRLIKKTHLMNVAISTDRHNEPASRCDVNGDISVGTTLSTISPITSESSRHSDNVADVYTVYSNTELSTRTLADGGNKNDEYIVNIYRYKFTTDFTEELYKFAKIHQYDHRTDFKDAWNIWIEENENIVTAEIIRLNQLDYDGDVIDKMFKSARYYFRKKNTEKKKPVNRKVYVTTQKILLEEMDSHIKTNILLGDFKPSEGFDDFCKNNIDIIKSQINDFIKAGIVVSSEIKLKIKKTYKNRYYLIANK